MDWTPVLDWLASHGVRILIILLVGAALYYVVRMLVPPAVTHSLKVRYGLKRKMKKKDEEEVEKRAKTVSRIFVGTGTVLILVAVILMILAEVGISITPLIAGLGIAGIAVGFGAQSLVKDIIAGIFILLENQYRVGDWVQIADTMGVVEEINLRRTILRDIDGVVHVVPNGEIRVASNFTKEWARVNLNVSVAYDTNLDHAIAVINKVGEGMAEEPYWKSLILKPPQAIRVDKLGDSGIDIRILGDTKPMRQWEVMGELRKRVKNAFDEEGIEIPWPHTKVYFGDVLPQKALGQVPTPAAPGKAQPLTPEDDAGE